jgi:aspartate 1-decarboxylase
MSFARYTPEEAAVHQPRFLVLNEKNEIVRYEGGASKPALKVVGE